MKKSKLVILTAAVSICLLACGKTEEAPVDDIPIVSDDGLGGDVSNTLQQSGNGGTATVGLNGAAESNNKETSETVQNSDAGINENNNSGNSETSSSSNASSLGNTQSKTPEEIEAEMREQIYEGVYGYWTEEIESIDEETGEASYVINSYQFGVNGEFIGYIDDLKDVRGTFESDDNTYINIHLDTVYKRDAEGEVMYQDITDQELLASLEESYENYPLEEGEELPDYTKEPILLDPIDINMKIEKKGTDKDTQRLSWIVSINGENRKLTKMNEYQNLKTTIEGDIARYKEAQKQDEDNLKQYEIDKANLDAEAKQKNTEADKKNASGENIAGIH